MYQAQARELAAGDDPIVGDEEIRWAIARVAGSSRGCAADGGFLGPGRSRLGAFLRQLDAGLRR